jgi:DNA-binding CsgD family transcriptional regulator
MTYTAQQHDEAMQRYLAGEPLKCISAAVGMHETTICQLAKRLGVPMRLKQNPRHAEIMRLTGLLYKPKQVAHMIGCTVRTVQNVIKQSR